MSTRSKVGARSSRISLTHHKGGIVGPARRTLPIATNMDSYDRHDPFNAFNTLIKLFGSLAKRVGACNLRLTPDEHKLSLYLLAVVEPYIGPTPSTTRTLLVRQPTEILDLIVFHLDERKDCLSLALTCQRIYDVVVPRHIDYRHVKSKISSISVWNHLAIHKELARNVRKLEIIDERLSSDLQCVPVGIHVSDTDLESTDDELELHEKHERFFVAALGHLTNLVYLGWSSNHSPISIDEIWPTLLKCQSLRRIEIDDNVVFCPPKGWDESEDNVKNKMTAFPHLKTVALRSTKSAYGASRQPGLSRIKAMLNNCPNLESLDISYTQPKNASGTLARLPADDLLFFGRWPHLTNLALTNLRSSLDITSMFLFAHLNIEVLSLDVTSSTPICLPAGSLPCLRELRANKEIISAILECPSTIVRPLDTIKGIRLVGGPSDRRILTNIQRYSSTVRRIDLASWYEMDDIRRLIESAPQLHWLDVGRKASGANKVIAGPVINLMEWATMLSAMPELSTFHGVKFFYDIVPGQGIVSTVADRSRMRKNEEVASIIGWKCPKLRRIDHWEDNGSKVIVLVKENERDKIKWEVRRIKQV